MEENLACRQLASGNSILSSNQQKHDNVEGYIIRRWITSMGELLSQSKISTNASNEVLKHIYEKL